MTYLLDTCVLSKGRKLKLYDNLKQWLEKHPDSSYFISAVSIGEIQTGISKLGPAEQKKKSILESWLLGDLTERFKQRILRIDVHTCTIWGQIRGEAQRKDVLSL